MTQGVGRVRPDPGLVQGGTLLRWGFCPAPDEGLTQDEAASVQDQRPTDAHSGSKVRATAAGGDACQQARGRARARAGVTGIPAGTLREEEKAPPRTGPGRRGATRCPASLHTVGAVPSRSPVPVSRAGRGAVGEASSYSSR